MKVTFSTVTKRRRRNLNAGNVFFHNKEKLIVDKENEIISEKVIEDDEIIIVKVVPSLVIKNKHARVRCSLGKGHHIDNYNCPCPVLNCTSGSLVSTFNAYPLDLREVILCTGIDLKKNKSKSS